MVSRELHTCNCVKKNDIIARKLTIDNKLHFYNNFVHMLHIMYMYMHLKQIVHHLYKYDHLLCTFSLQT